MTLTIGQWGIGLVIGGFVMNLFLDDVYLNVPGFGELAWNRTGFYVDRAVKPSSGGSDHPEAA